MATRPEASDPAVDELRRKARRRLVGAIVLALAAAVALPLLLENEPKPLGDDVSIRIPPIDSGKFVTPLSPAAPPDTKAKSDNPAPGTSAASAPLQAPAASEPAKIDSGKADSAKTEAGAKADSGSARADSPSAAPRAADGDAPATKSAAPAAAAPSTDALPGTETKPDSQRTGGFAVQVAAFSDRYGARSLVVKLKRSGFPSYIETVTSDKGTLHRVRVGPYGSRESADAARAKLKAAGFSGVVARSG